MRLFKLFWGWTKNTSFSPTHGFFSPLLYPKIFPCYLPHFISHSFHLQSLGELSNLSSIELWGDVRQGLRKVESSTLKEHGEEKARGVFHPKCRSERRKVSSFPSLHFFFFLMVLFSLCFFLFLCLRRRWRRRHRLPLSFFCFCLKWRRQRHKCAIAFFFLCFLLRTKQQQ